MNKEDIITYGKQMYGTDFQLTNVWTIKFGLDGADVEPEEDEDYSSIVSTKGVIKMWEAKEKAFKAEHDKILTGWKNQKDDPEFHKYLLRFLRNREDGSKLTTDKLERFDQEVVHLICFHLIENRVEYLKFITGHLKLLRQLLFAKEKEM